MSCVSKELGYFCSCQGWVKGIKDHAKYKWYHVNNKINRTISLWFITK